MSGGELASEMMMNMKHDRVMMLGLALVLAMFYLVRRASFQRSSDLHQAVRSGDPPSDLSSITPKLLHHLNTEPWFLCLAGAQRSNRFPGDVRLRSAACSHTIRLEQYTRNMSISESRLPQRDVDYTSLPICPLFISTPFDGCQDRRPERMVDSMHDQDPDRRVEVVIVSGKTQ